MTVSPASVSGAEYYAHDGYYTIDEGSSEWMGEGAQRLGLEGRVKADQFAQIIDGVLPDGTELARGADGTRNNGTDLTFSAPKSVSLVGLIGGDKRVIEAHRNAVRETMIWAEEKLALARSGAGGAERELTGNLVQAHFHHDLSRALDPQVHTHCVVANMTQRADGEWRALHNVKLWQHAPLLGAAYHAQLRSNLAELGYETQITGKHGSFEVSGISREAIEAFSERAKDIREKARELGLSSPKAMEAIAVRSRDAKQHGSSDLAVEKWGQKAGPYRAEIEQVMEAARARTQPRSVLATVRSWGEALLERITKALGPRPDPMVESAAKARKGGELAAGYSAAAGVRHLAERSASFDRMELLKSALGFAEKGATVRTIESRIDALVGEGVLVKGRAGSEHAERLTTRGLLETERAIINAAKDGAGQGQALLPQDKAEEQIAAIEERRGFALSYEQKGAALSLLSGANRIQIIQGDAGTGKSTLFGFVNEVAGNEGRAPLFLTSQSALVADMRGEGLEAQTLASVLVPYANHDVRVSLTDTTKDLLSDRLVIVEEASMVSTLQAKLLTELTDKAGSLKLAFVGDEKQIAPVAAGRAFALMQEHGAPSEKLVENRRQLDPDLREAVEHARAGDIGKTFEALGERVVEAANPAQAAAELYLSLSPDERDKTSLLTSGHVLREAVLDQVRGELIESGELGREAVTLTVLDHLNLTREELRNIRSWGEGMQLELYRDQAGLDRGRYEVGIVSRDDHLVQLKSNGDEHWIDPRDFHSNGSGASLAVPGEMEVREGDRLLFTAPDKGLGVVKGTRASVTGIEGDTLHLASGERDYTLGPDHPARERLGHAAVINMHRAQGITVDKAITVMSSGDTLLNSQSLHYVLQTRAREELSLITDDKAALQESIVNHRGDVPHALDLAPELSDANGERFDPKTGELLDAPAAKEPDAAELFERAMADEFAEPEKESETMREQEIERDEPDLGDDFEMEM